MTLAHSFAFEPVPAVADAQPHPFTTIADPLGPLASPPGHLDGDRLQHDLAAALPVRAAQDRFLELNLTSETLVFEEIPGAIPNRGLDQKDIEMFGVHYMQQISDSTLTAGHPPRAGHLGRRARHDRSPGAADRGADGLDPPRHGPAGPGQGVHGRRTAEDRRGVDIIPFGPGAPGTKGTFADAEAAFPELDMVKKTSSASRPTRATVPGITQAMVKNPNSVLKKAIRGRTSCTPRCSTSRRPTPTRPASAPPTRSS